MNRSLRRSSFDGTNRGRLAAATLCAGALAVLAAIAGCGTSTTGTSGSAKPQNARQAITLASDDTQRANSMAGTFSMRFGSGTATTGTIQMQRVPSLVFDENLSTPAGGSTLPITVIMSTSAIYLKEPALSHSVGKPWLEVPFSGLSGNGSALAQMFESAQNGNPLEQTQMLAASKNVRAVGTQVVDGVQTTHYTGSFTPSAAASALSASDRKNVRPMLSVLSGDIRFNAWIDAQHQVRRVTEVETASGEPVTVTINITAINQPVHIAVPPASQVTTVPKSGL